MHGKAKSRVCWCLAAALGFTAILMTATISLSPAIAQVGAGQSPSTITLDVYEADLSQVVRLLMSESNQNIIIADQDVKQKKVTAMLNGVPLETALKYVVQSVGSTLQKQDGVYIIGGKLENESPAVSNSSETSPEFRPLTPALENYVARRQTVVETIKLLNTRPVDMMWQLGLYQVEDVARVRASVVKPGVYIRKPDGELTPMVFPGDDTPPMTESLKGNPNYAERATAFTGEAAQALPPAPPGGYPTTRPTTTATTPTTRPGTTTATQPGTSTTSGLLPEGIEYMMPYDLDNSLIVRGDPEGISELKTIISMLDVAPKQISIEAKFVSISTSELDSLGINWSIERLNSTMSTNFNIAGNVIVGYAASNWMANLRTQLTNTSGKLINAPIVTTMNNVPATIGFSTEVPYLNSTTVYSSTGTPTSSSWVDTYSVESYLEVFPRINSADNSITLQISPQLSDIEQFVPAGDMNLPIVNSQWVQTTRRVRDGETVVLGGLIRQNTTETIEKIPLLGDLPIIGRLFRSTNKNVDDKELLIFLTPKIIPDAPIAGAGIGVIP